MPSALPADLTTVNIQSREHKRDPFPFYARLRAEAPVFRLPVPVVGEAWLVTRYDDVVAALRDDGLFVKDAGAAGLKRRAYEPPWMPASLRALENNMLDQDDPNHKRLRALVNQAFTRRRVDALRERTQKIADELLAATSRPGPVDLVADYALPLPLLVICELLGVPASDRRKFHRWSKAMLNVSTKVGLIAAIPHVFAFMRYLKRLFRARREVPQDDLVTALVEAEEAGERLAEHELTAMVILLLIAGHETTVNLIASGTLALLQNPDQRDRLIAEPGLMDSAVEELLRYVAPVEHATERYAAADTTLQGQTICRGELVLAVIASANRDGTHFSDPDRLILDRSPNTNLAFGHGIHYCLGAQLARMEASIAFRSLFDRFPDLALAGPAENLRWRRTPVVRGLEALPVRLAGSRAGSGAPHADSRPMV